MAILLLISNDNVNEPYQYLDDIIGVYADDHPFSDYELARFSFLSINGSVADTNAVLSQLKPLVADAYFNSDSGKWQFDPDSGTITQTKRVWKYDGNKWYNLANPFKFTFNISDLTPEEKQLLQTYDITHPSVVSAIQKLRKDLSSDPQNNVEEVDLKNKEP